MHARSYGCSRADGCTLGHACLCPCVISSSPYTQLHVLPGIHDGAGSLTVRKGLPASRGCSLTLLARAGPRLCACFVGASREGRDPGARGRGGSDGPASSQRRAGGCGRHCTACAVGVHALGQCLLLFLMGVVVVVVVVARVVVVMVCACESGIPICTVVCSSGYVIAVVRLVCRLNQF